MDKLYLRIKKAERTLRTYLPQAKNEDLRNGCCFLEHQALSTANECRYTIEKSRLLKLFERCRELCAEGILPDEDSIENFFAEGLDGIETVLLPLALSCALTDIASEATKKKESAGERILINSAASLRKITETDFDSLSEKLFKAESILLKDPSGAYRESDNKTKAQYRKALTVKADFYGKTEEEIAVEAVEKSKLTGDHVGRYIFGKKSQARGFLFLAMEILMPLAASFAAAVLCRDYRIGFLLFFPLWEVFRYPIESVSLKNVQPSAFFRLSSDSAKVRNIRGLITVSVVMPSPDKIKGLEKHLCVFNQNPRSRGCNLKSDKEDPVSNHRQQIPYQYPFGLFLVEKYQIKAHQPRKDHADHNAEGKGEGNKPHTQRGEKIHHRLQQDKPFNNF